MLLLAICLASIFVAIGNRYQRHRQLWSQYSANSLPKSEWKKRGAIYYYVQNKGFQCLELMDSNYVDFRVRGNSDRWITSWRIPFSPSALTNHLEFLDLEFQPGEPTQDILEDVATEFPKDWGMTLSDQLQFYLRCNCDDFSYFSRFLIVDTDNGIIYFFDLDNSIPG